MSNVVITGSTRGIGLAMARKFLELGDEVIISSSNEENVSSRLVELQEEFGKNVEGIKCDVTSSIDLQRLSEFAEKRWKSGIDYFICNAGVANSTRTKLVDIPDGEIRRVIEINTIGTLMSVKYALRAMRNRGHIFIMEGLGTMGGPSPNLIPYGISKAGYVQLEKSLVKEYPHIGIHALSPGMVLTDLLLANSDKRVRRIFNILAERPETVADFLVPRIKRIKGTGKRIKFMSKYRASIRFMTAWRYKNRFFDEEGNPVD